MTKPEGARCLRAAVDWLEIAFRVEVDDDVKRTVGSARVRARKHGRAELELWRDSPVRGRWRECWTAEAREVGKEKVILRNQRVDVTYDERAPGGVAIEPGAEAIGWNIAIRASNDLLQREGVQSAIREAWETAARFGEVLDARLRRVDLAADLVGFNFDPMTDVERLVKRSRSKLKPYRVYGEQYELFREAEVSCEDNGKSVLHLLGARFEGISVSPGAVVSGRIYDKTHELTVKQDEVKRDVLRAAWLEGGWQGQRVDRVEFQVRGEALDELGMRGASATDLMAHLETLWKYLTRQWLRLVDPSSHRRRCLALNDPRWDVVQAVEFTDARLAVSGKVHRTRRTFGARAAQATGCVVSMIAASGELPDAFGALLTGDGEVVTADDVGKHLTAHEAGMFLGWALRAIYLKGGELAHRAEIQKHGTPQEALAHMMTRYLATRARLGPQKTLVSSVSHEKGDPCRTRGRWLPEPGQQRLALAVC